MSGLVPAPTTAVPGEGAPFRARGELHVAVDPALRAAARTWATWTEAVFDVDVVAHPEEVPGTRLLLTLGADTPPGGYELTVDAERVQARCHDLAGAHAVVQTLRQLAGSAAFRVAPTGRDRAPLKLPAVRVVDAPRSQWRGLLIDVARHFLPKAALLRLVDLAAMHRLNVLHLHLTDDQGWRMEVHHFPELTRVGAWRTESTVGDRRSGHPDGRPHGGYYTQDDLREVVAHARAQGITVVPEIDVPGHVQAAVAAYPELGVTKRPVPVWTTWGISEEVLDPSPQTLDFFRTVLDEVVDVFGSPWIGLGGDEVPTRPWRASPHIVAQARELGLSDVAELHGWFLARLCDHVRGHGRRAVVWDEALGPQLPTDAVVLSWRGWTRGLQAMAAGHDVVMAPEQVLYLDHRAGAGPEEPVPVGFVRTVEDVYAFELVPTGAEDELAVGTATAAPGRLLGAQAQVWTEHLDDPRTVDRALFPRLAAFAEAVWSPPADRAPGSPAAEDFLERLGSHHLPRLAAAGVEYRPLAGPLPWQQRPGVPGHHRDLSAELAAAGFAGAGGLVEEPGQ
ncbi:beta-N-acetylhexosaminidase [Georgenia satyanarayanai]|uniref:beta-N-acetylhexosaminidase n=1 Tax=Georgenia satyanarayanai TaxID=860221 RepID=UPI00203E5CAE|nr:beta-N-acetylhexosaminidase [Georgenia satyanarayanai]MCM3660266.1 beta-N-acetylhexosaminidase [Georgenia satyanarayanai]